MYNLNTNFIIKKIKIMKKIFLLFLLLPNIVSANYDDYLESANFLSEKGIIVNQKNNPEKYNLDKFILRQEFVWTISKSLNLPEKKVCENKFEDVRITPDNSWACLRIEEILEAWIVFPHKRFNPKSYITKSEVLWVISKSFYKNEYDYFEKSNVGKNWQEVVKEFSENQGFLTEDFSNPNEAASRWFVFEVFRNVLKLKNEDFKIHENHNKLYKKHINSWIEKILKTSKNEEKTRKIWENLELVLWEKWLIVKLNGEIINTRDDFTYETIFFWHNDNFYSFYEELRGYWMGDYNDSHALINKKILKNIEYFSKEENIKKYLEKEYSEKNLIEKMFLKENIGNKDWFVFLTQRYYESFYDYVFDIKNKKYLWKFSSAGDFFRLKDVSFVIESGLYKGFYINIFKDDKKYVITLDSESHLFEVKSITEIEGGFEVKYIDSRDEKEKTIIKKYFWKDLSYDKKEIFPSVFIEKTWDIYSFIVKNKEVSSVNIYDFRLKFREILNLQWEKEAKESYKIPNNIDVSNFDINDDKLDEYFKEYIYKIEIKEINVKGEKLTTIYPWSFGYQVAFDKKTNTFFEFLRLIEFEDFKRVKWGFYVFYKDPIWDSEIRFIDEKWEVHYFATEKYPQIKSFSVLENGDIEIEYYSEYSEYELFEPENKEKNSKTKKVKISR